MNLSPLPLQKFFDNNGRPLVGGQLFTYEAGTNNKIATYQNQAGTPNTNPVVLNYRGEANVWLDQTLTYKFVLARENDTDPPTNPIWTVDNISAAITFASLTQQIIGQILFPRSAAEAAVPVTPTNYGYTWGDVRRFGAIGDGGADDTTAINTALSVGGDVYMPSGFNFKCNSNLTLVSNTRLYIDGTLTLNTSRLTAYLPGGGGVRIINRGKIVSQSLATGVPYPTGWNCRGFIEFGGTLAQPATDFTLTGSGEIDGSWTGTPGTIVVTPTDQRRGVFITNAQRCTVEGQTIHGTIAEAVLLNTTSATPPDREIVVCNNIIYACNHDAISQAGLYVYTFEVYGNVMRACLNGVETNAGDIHDNYAFDMVGSGYGCGGNGNAVTGSPLVFKDNVSRNNGGTGFDMQCAPLAAGHLIIQGNHSYNDGAFGFLCTYWDNISFKGNSATGWGRMAAGSAFAISNTNYAYVDDNHCWAEGASSNGGFNMAMLSGGQLIYGADNITRGVTVPFVNDTTTGAGPKPALGPVFSQVSQKNHTGTTTPTVIASCVVPAKILGRTNGVEIIVGGTLSGTAGTKTINIRFGGSNAGQLSILAATTGSWMGKVSIMNSGSASAQLVLSEAVHANAITMGSTSLAINTANDVTIDIQVTLGSAADTVTQNIFIVRALQGLQP